MLLQTLNYQEKQKEQVKKRINYYLEIQDKKIRELNNYEDTEIIYGWLCTEIDRITEKLNYLYIALAIVQGQGCYEYP